ncbi:MAG: hypothetical protein FE78DRAFT_233630 [Acidomyces sp. 'richmondensis']|nr:MAG: hypothetical protein FE78DRAFT_233630 [Acidomyces sp. 'richmondensis']
MEIPSFREVQSELAGANANQTEYRCVFAEPHESRCLNLIEKSRLEKAIELLRTPQQDLNRKDIWDIVTYLVCEAHQEKRNYRPKHTVEMKWQREFPKIQLGSPRPKASNSLCSSRGGTPPRRRQSGTSTPQCSTPETTSDGSRELLAPSIFNIQETDHQRSVRASEMFVQGPQESIAEANEEPADEFDMVMSSEVFTLDTSEIARNREAEAQSVSNIAHESPLQQRKRKTAISSPLPAQQEGFFKGPAASWAPWTIRSEVRSLLLEPLPKPRDRGSIYVVQDVNFQYVKIGITMDPFSERLKNLRKEHCNRITEDNSYHIPGIPYTQLLRLEKLVHKDLAFFQRTLRLRKGEAYKTHREWFAVDMSTAKTTIHMWWDIMCKTRIEPGCEIDKTARENLMSSAAFDVDMAQLTDQTQSWAEANEDHESRFQLWKTLLLSTGSKSQDEFSWAWWLKGGLFVWMVLRAFEVPGQVAFVGCIILAAWLNNHQSPIICFRAILDSGAVFWRGK